MEERIERIKQQLAAHSYKLTPQREVTVKVLLENEKAQSKCGRRILTRERKIS